MKSSSELSLSGIKRLYLTNFCIHALILLLLCLPLIALADEEFKAIQRGKQESASRAHEVGLGDLYAIVVGVSSYSHPKIPILNLADKDARDFADFLARQKGLFRQKHLTLLLNKDATSAEVKKHLFYKLRKAGKNDTVVLFFSGHGADDPNMPGEFFFLTHDADPQYLEATAVNLTQMKFMKRLDSRRVVLIADTCHAGGFSIYGAKSLEPSLEKFLSQFKESEGKVILTSSRPDEVSLEKPDLGNSVFTYYLIRGLQGDADTNRDGVISLREAYDYVYENTKNATNGVQHPQWEGQLVGSFPMSLVRVPGTAPTQLGTDRSPQVDTAKLEPQKPALPASTEQGRPFSEEVNRLLRLAESGDPKAQTELGDLYYYGRGAPKDFEEAAKWYRKAADQGHARGQNELGYLYFAGEGVLKDHGHAATWFRKAADQGYARAQNDLGNLYYSGKGVPKDYGEAVKWYQRAAEKDYTRAQDNLGDMFFYGRGVPKDFAEAVKWYRKAAEKGFARAQANVGDMYYFGRGVPKDYVEAVKWYRKAADQGYARAQNDMGDAYYYGRGVSQDHSEAYTWYRKAADQGHARAQNDLGDLHYLGKGQPQDYAEAAKWYRKAAEQGFAVAQNNLGDMYYYGRGVQQDYAEAARWYKRAADQENAKAQDNLGYLYESGKGVSKDETEALKWYRKAADQGFALAQYHLGTSYHERGLRQIRDTLARGVRVSRAEEENNQNLAEAARWYTKAAEQGYAAAQERLGSMYLDGHGVPKNRSQAEKWLRKASEQGNAKAKDALRKIGARSSN